MYRWDSRVLARKIEGPIHLRLEHSKIKLNLGLKDGTSGSSVVALIIRSINVAAVSPVVAWFPHEMP
jgi:3-deoxy-D-arabino-heptulosonate 7-phosphate (DAHP) synthase